MFDFSARPGVASNGMTVTANSLTLLTVSADGTAISTNTWAPYQQSFIANATSTVIAFADTGASDSLGTLLDNVSLCFEAAPILGCTDIEADNFSETATVDNGTCTFGGDEGEGDFDTYRIEGYVWHDNNKNQEWEGFGDSLEEGEESLAGWVVTITNGTTTLSTTTDATGKYFFEVREGTWTITGDVKNGWRGTTVESYTVTVPEKKDEPEVSIVAAIKEFFIPVAHAAVLGTYGPYNFGVDTAPNGGGRSLSDTPDGDVAGVSTTTTPEPMVLGEQVSVVPTGAPNTGAGGAAQIYIIGYLVAMPRRNTTII